MIFKYGDKETEYLKKKDKRLGEAIDIIGHIERSLYDDLFGAVIYTIVGQQISAAALETVWSRLRTMLGHVNAEAVNNADEALLQSAGITFKKAGYMKNFTEKVLSGQLDLDSLSSKSDEEVIAELSALNGLGIWSAEMIMLFTMERGDILSFGDLAIHRGLRMLYHHKSIDKSLFEKYRKRYSPYGSVASLYLWAISAGAIPHMKDYAPIKKKVAKK